MKKRLLLLDTLRGISVLSMIVYHGVYDWVYLYGHSVSWFLQKEAYLWQQSICWTFILLAGAVFSYGKNWVKRGLLLLGCSAILTGVTYFATPSQFIVFGVIHFYTLATFVTGISLPLLQKIKPAIGFVVSFLAFLLCKGIPRGFLGFGDVAIWALPQTFYQSKATFWLGFPHATFSSADYFPLLPWLFLFWSGLFLWKLLQPIVYKKIEKFPNIPIVTWIGQHSLWIYMLHQPILMVLVGGLNLLFSN